MEIHRSVLQIDHHQLRVFNRLPYRAAPSFLGEFSFCTYSKLTALPQPLVQVATDMKQFAPDQKFNVAFIQRYREGEYVRRHRDPVSNKGFTLIAIFGEFEGALSEVAGEEFQLQHGDLLKLECTIAGLQGPPHSVSTIISGTRYALILNTIEHD
jgi:hypothetical protein